MKCDSCRYWDRDLDEYPCNKCVHNSTDNFKPMSNFDKIVSMTIEELAAFLCGVYDMEEDNAKYINGTIIPCYNEDDIREWLEREVDYDE